MTQIISALSDISKRYKAMFVDLWGCVHNGIVPFPEAVAALQAYRRAGGIVVLVTNSPRPRASVATQLAQIGVPVDAYDTIATSGDSARAAMFQGVVGRKVYHIGLPDEGGFFEPLALLDEPVEIERVSLDEAEGIVCTGPFDSLADPAVNRPAFLAAKTRGLKLLCANPDIIVDRGEVREWCAGALAQLYTEMGGESLYFGKPHPPIYDLARRRLAQIDDVADSEILAIGDGIGTDVSGALGEDLDVLFISGGLAARETGTGTTGGPEASKLAAYLTDHQSEPRYTIGMLR